MVGIAALLLIAALIWQLAGRRQPLLPAPGGNPGSKSSESTPAASSQPGSPKPSGGQVHEAPTPSVERREPASAEKLESVFRRLLELERLTKGEYAFEKYAALRDELLGLLGSDPMAALLGLLPKVADEEVAVLVVGSIVSLSDSQNPELVLAAVSTVGRVSQAARSLDPSTAGALLQLVESDQARPRLREGALRALEGRLNYDPEGFARLRRIFASDPAESVRAGAFRLLQSFAEQVEPRERELLFQAGRAALTFPGEGSRRAAALLLSRDGTAAGALLEAWSRETSPAVKSDLVQALSAQARTFAGQLDPEKHDQLVRTLIDASREGETLAVQMALQKLGDVVSPRTVEEAYTVLKTRILASQEWPMKPFAIQSLGEMGRRGFHKDEIRKRLEEVSHAASTPDAVRDACVAALLRLGP